MALMLMDPIEAVVHEIRRVLKPGGLFAAVVQGEFVRGDAWEAFVAAAREILNQEGGAGTLLGDRRAWSVEGLHGLFCAATGFDEPMVTEDFILHLDGSVKHVRECLSLTYYAGVLSSGGVDALKDRTAGILTAHQRRDGMVPCSLGLRLVLCRRAGRGT
jgi:SAM-dependent methyltransferase